MTFWVLAVLVVTSGVVGAYFGYEFAVRRAEAWVRDHVAKDHQEATAEKYGLSPSVPQGMAELARALVDGWRWYNPPWGDGEPNQALISDAAVDVFEELAKHGYTVSRVDKK